jgi:ribose-phosphate pyrophosphokinase
VNVRDDFDLTLLAGSGQVRLAGDVAAVFGVPVAKREIERFPDGECHVELTQSVRGHDVYIVQSTGLPVEANLLELLLLADACRRAGSGRLTAVVPYFGYARQDRRASGREPVSARLIVDLIQASGFDREVSIDLHTASLEGFFSVPLEHLTAVPALAEALARGAAGSFDVVVAPDLGAAKLADRYARLLDLPVAIVHKTRLSGHEVVARGITGEVAGRRPLIVDDMISTGGTIEAAARSLAAAGALPVVAVVATHGLFVEGSADRLSAIGARRWIVTDSLTPKEDPRLPVEVVSVAPLLARTVRNLHENRSLAEMALHT